MDLENYWISQLKNPYIGDDGAIVDGKIYAMDAFFEDTHFKRSWMSMEQIAHKAFMVNLSDMVAMNAKAKYMLITLNIPKDIKKEQLDRLGNRLKELAKEYEIEIIGGDTIGSTKLGLTITMIGESRAPLKRVGVKRGDLIAYTGVLGEAKKDLEKLFNGERISDNSKFYNPILRIDFVRAATPWLSAGMDISDGLYCDTNKLLELNGLFLKELKIIPPSIGESGEEYEMLIAFSPNNLDRIKKIAKYTNTP
ncbi:MAG: thiamine-phosphate kinase, partial [Epsilonproteobacteria bacterium]|nr:thiamine-phosphate kinase [Campylobacterota bacterium]